MNPIFLLALSLLLLPPTARLFRRSYSLSLLALLFAGICFSQKDHLNPLSRLLSSQQHALPDSDADGLPDEIEKSGHLPLPTPFAWYQHPETDLFQPWQRFTVASDFKNIGGDLFISPAGYLSFGRPLNSPTLQDYPLTNTLRRAIPQIAFAQGSNRHIPGETAASLIFDHCVGVDYDSGGIDLSQFLHPTSKPYLSEFSWDVGNNEILYDNPRLYISKTPKELYPEIREIILRNRAGDIIYDQLFLVILHPDTRNEFTHWQNRNTDLSWISALPFPPKMLIYSGGEKFPLCQVPDNVWKTPGYFEKSYYHHLAHLDIRTREAVNGHGHQACYNEQGLLITGGVSAGSADKISAPSLGHRDQDVKPFIRALQLDGNPIHPTNGFGGIGSTMAPTHLTRPFIYGGSFTKEYLRLRPPHVQ